MLERSDIASGMSFAPAKPCIVIVPTSRQTDVVLRAWAHKNGNGEPPIVETMAGFLRRLGNHLLPAGPTILGEDQVDVLIRHVISDSSMLHAIGFEAQKLVRWTQYGATPRYVDELADKAGLHTRRGRMLAEIATAWKRLLDLYGGLACDRGTYERHVQSIVADVANRPLRNASGDVISSCVMIATHGVTTADRELLATLAQHGWDVGVGFASELENVPGLHDLISASATDAAWFVSQGWHQGANEQSLPQYDLVNVNLPSREEEVRRVIASIKTDVASGISLRDITVCVPGASVYRQIIDDHARRAGLPLEVKKHLPLAAWPAATAAKALCDLVCNDWKRDDLERFLSHSTVIAYIRGVSDLLHVARYERIPGGEGPLGWRRRLEMIVESCQAQAETTAHEGDRKNLERRGRRAERALVAINSIALFAPSTATALIAASVFAESLRIALDGMGLATRQQETYEKLTDLLETYAGLMERHALPKRTFAEHAESWWRLVSAAGSKVERALGSGVAVLAPAELRCRPWQRVYVLGMVEGEFPRISEHVTDREIIPGVLERMYLQSMTDIVYAVSAGGRLVLTRPTHIDQAATLPSSLHELIGREPLGSVPLTLDATVPLAIHRHDLRPPTSDVYRAPQVASIHDVQQADIQEKIIAELHRPLSPSRLDVFTQCPYQFYAEKILRLGSVDVQDAKLTPMERGRMLHGVVAAFFASLQPSVPYDAISTANELLSLSVRLDPARIDEYWELLQRIAHQHMGTDEWMHAYANLDRHTLFGSQDRPGLLLQWLHLEIAYQQATRHYPTLLEIAIDDEIELPHQGAHLKVPISTRVDRIDVAESNGVITFIVNDYKASVSTGYGLSDIRSGKLSQMPIYLEAATKWFKQHGIEAIPWAAFYRSFGKSLHKTDDPLNRVALQDPAMVIDEEAPGIKPMYITGKVKEFTDRPLVEQNQINLETISAIVTRLHDGTFPVRPATAEVCKNCDAQELCRIEHWGIA